MMSFHQLIFLIDNKESKEEKGSKEKEVISFSLVCEQLEDLYSLVKQFVHMVKETKEDKYFVLNYEYSTSKEIAKYLQKMFTVDFEEGKAFEVEQIKEKVEPEDVFFPTGVYETATVLDISSKGQLKIDACRYERIGEKIAILPLLSEEHFFHEEEVTA